MKKYTKKWLTSFLITVLLFTCAILAFLLFTNKNNTPDLQSSEITDTPEQDTDPLEPYVNIQDNVGGVSFTEDQITELVRNIYSLDGFLTNLKVDFTDDGGIAVRAKIKDSEKLIEQYPELSGFSPLLNAIENKDISISGTLSENQGLAQYEISQATVGDITLNKSILSPFIEQGDFSALFDVDFDSVQITEDMLVFKNGIPAILQY